MEGTIVLDASPRYQQQWESMGTKRKNVRHQVCASQRVHTDGGKHQRHGLALPLLFLVTGLTVDNQEFTLASTPDSRCS